MRKAVILKHSDVITHLPMHECIGVMSGALESLARGEVDQPLRSVVKSPDPRGFLGLMPAFWSGSTPYWGLKEVCVFPDNPSAGLDSHLGAVLLHDGETGELVAIAEASAITAIRTAAVSAVATDLLAREEASVLAIVGTGAQARTHLQAIPLVRHLNEIRVAGSHPENAYRFAEETGSSGVVRPARSVQEAVEGADIIVTATSSTEPVLERNWVRAGCHINLVGSCAPRAREADSATIAAGRLYVDRRESTINESGDYLFALREGVIDQTHVVAEIGELLLDRSKGRGNEDEITIFKSLGLAIEDLAAAAYLYEKLLATGEGTWIALGE